MKVEINRKGWGEFREAGLLWWVNRGLHLFGWAIVLEVEDDGSVSECNPARAPSRGFCRADEEDGFRLLSSHLEENAAELNDEARR